MTLIALAYYFNYNGASVLILLSHDFSDVLVCVTKSLMDTTYMRLMLVVYCALVISWAVTRLYFLPIYIIIPAWHNDIGLAEG